MEGKNYEKTSGYLWQTILILAGVIFLILSFTTKDAGKTFTTLNGLGTSLLLSGIIGLFFGVIMNRKDAKYKVCEEWGIKNIYETRAIANLTIDACEERAKERVDVIAFGLRSWRQAKKRLIDSMLSQGVEIRIITMSPDNPALPMRDNAEGKKQGSTKESILQLRKFFNQTEARK